MSLHNTPLARARDRKPRLGLIFPVAGRGVPEEGLALYGDRVEFIIGNLDLKTMTPAGYDAVIANIPEKARALAAQGVEAILIMGTSLTFYQGRDFNENLVLAVAAATGLPVSTMSNGILHALLETRGRTIACATAYNDEVNARLATFLEAHDFHVPLVRGLQIEAVGDIFSVTDEQLIDFCADTAAKVPEADALLISCGGLITLDVLAPVEARTSLPVVASTPHALYEGVKLLGMDPHVPGYGRVLAGN